MASTKSKYVFHSCQAVSVEINEHGDVVITQERDATEDSDHVIIVPMDRLSLLIQALTDIREG